MQVVCVSVSGRPSEVEFISPGSQERMNLKWSVAYNDIEIVDGKKIHLKKKVLIKKSKLPCTFQN